ncbi:hypothetical protein U0070_021873, partial [Myodes glareolus]
KGGESRGRLNSARKFCDKTGKGGLLPPPPRPGSLPQLRLCQCGGPHRAPHLCPRSNPAPRRSLACTPPPSRLGPLGRRWSVASLSPGPGCAAEAAPLPQDRAGRAERGGRKQTRGSRLPSPAVTGVRSGPAWSPCAHTHTPRRRNTQTQLPAATSTQRPGSARAPRLTRSSQCSSGGHGFAGCTPSCTFHPGTLQPARPWDQQPVDSGADSSLLGAAARARGRAGSTMARALWCSLTPLLLLPMVRAQRLPPQGYRASTWRTSYFCVLSAKLSPRLACLFISANTHPPHTYTHRLQHSCFCVYQLPPSPKVQQEPEYQIQTLLRDHAIAMHSDCIFKKEQAMCLERIQRANDLMGLNESSPAVDKLVQRPPGTSGSRSPTVMAVWLGYRSIWPAG